MEKFKGFVIGTERTGASFKTESCYPMDRETALEQAKKWAAQAMRNGCDVWEFGCTPFNKDVDY